MPSRRFGAVRSQRNDGCVTRRRGLIGLVAIVALSCAASGAEPARAGTYVMRNCDVPGHGNALIGPWIDPKNPEPVTLVDGCPSGDGLSFVLGTGSVSAGSNTAIVLAKPAGVRSQVTFVKATLWYAARLQGSGWPLHVLVNDLWSDSTAQRVLDTGPPGSESLTADFPLSPHTSEIHVQLHCGVVGGTPGPPESCVPTSSVPLLLRGMAITLREDAPPIVLPPGGTLLASGPQRGERTLIYAASDAQSGLAQIDVLLGDNVVANRDLTPRCPYSDFTVCPASQDETLQIDTRAVTNGTYPLTLRVRDAAGNERLVDVADAVEVDNPRDIGPSDVSPYTLTVQFSGTAGSTLSVPYGRRVSIRGQLKQGTEPVPAGTQIEVLKTLDRRGAHEVLAGRVVTQADGSFSLPLPTTRPSRTVRLAYRTSTGGDVASRALKIRVHAASRVSASLRGRVVRFSGRVLSGPMPKGGKRVEMEGRSPGSAWTPFKFVRTDKNGRFSGTYRLRVRRPGVVLKVRAVVTKEDGYGYLSSQSRAVSLRVR